MLFQAQHCRNISNLSKQLEKFSLVIFTTPKRRISFLPSAAYKNAVRRYSNKETELTDHLKSPENALTTGQKVKQAGKDASYMGVLLIGFGVTENYKYRDHETWHALSSLTYKE